MRRFSLTLLLMLAAAPTRAAAPADFQPDPKSVQRFGPAYRYPQAGWTVLHIEGEPYERGVQHGRLMAPDIEANVKCCAAVQSWQAPANGWKHTRTLVNALFMRRYAKEYLEEMKGIADGASAAGARFDGRPIDLLDVIALNSWPEIDTLDSALDATSNGLEAIKFGLEKPKAPTAPKPMRCSAFAATGPATADGKIVFGHITMFSLYPSSFYNVWIDVKPTKGHRVFMQSYPGGIQSGLDYYFNDAGLLVCETTLAQTRFDSTGLTVASRIREALQYADDIDKAVAILKQANNGLYTNEWLLGDIKTNEIAMFELGTFKNKLYRSGDKEWFGGTEGFYWGCNNTKDLQVRLETIASVEGRSENALFRPSDRDRKWLELYDAHKGKIDVNFGKLAFTTTPLAAYHSVDAKFTTSAMAKDLKTWALFGPPLGRTWEPTFEERKHYPDVQPLVSNPWAVLTAAAPAKTTTTEVVDLHSPEDGKRKRLEEGADETLPPTVPAWRGTLLPKTDADVWLADAFAGYEKIVALEEAMRKQNDGKLKAGDRRRLALDLFAHRANYTFGVRGGGDVPLAKTKPDLRQDWWYRVASGKGVLLLHALRERMGAEAFGKLMEDFGRQNAGQEVTTAAFRAAAEKATDKKLDVFFDEWLQGTGLPGEKEGVVGGPFSVLTFEEEPDQVVIVYGTRDEVHTNREAAEALQRAVRERHSNVTVPIRTDREVTDDELKGRHVVLIGRPGTNALVERWRKRLPFTFGDGSFEVQGQTFAHAGSGVVAAMENPLNPRYSLVVAAGLGPAATLRTAPKLAGQDQLPAEVVIYPAGGGPRSLVVSTPSTMQPEKSASSRTR